MFINNVRASGISLALILIFTSGIVKAEVSGLTLDNAIQKTIEANPELQRFSIRSQQLQYELDSSSLRPQVNLELEVENFSGSGELGGFDAAESTLALSSVIELGDKRGSRINAQNEKIKVYRTESQIQTVDVLSNLTMTYISGISVQEKIKLSNESVQLLENILSTVKRRFDQGIAPEADLIRAKAALSKEKLELNSLTQEQSVIRQAIASYWGSTSPEFDSLEGDLYQFSEDIAFSQLYEQVKSSPSVQLFAEEMRLKQAEVKLAKANGRSNLEWRLGVRQLEENGDTALVAGLSMPLFSGSRNQSMYESAKLDMQLSDLNRDQALIELHQRLYQAYSKRQLSIQAVNTIKNDILPDLEKAETLTRNGYENGRYRYQDVVSAQEELLQAKWGLVEEASSAALNQSIIEQLIAQSLSK